MLKMLYILIIITFCFVTPAFASDNGVEYATFMGFTLNTVNLADVQEKFGRATLVETGDAGGYEASICYSLPNGYVVRFLSGELGGPDHELLGYAVEKSVVSSEEKCASINPSAIAKFAPEIGNLKIGMTREEFSSLFKKIQWLNNTGQSFISSKERMTEKEIQDMKKDFPEVIENPFMDVSVTVIGEFNNERLNKFTVWRVRTY